MSLEVTVASDARNYQPRPQLFWQSSVGFFKLLELVLVVPESGLKVVVRPPNLSFGIQAPQAYGIVGQRVEEVDVSDVLSEIPDDPEGTGQRRLPSASFLLAWKSSPSQPDRE